MGKSNGAEGNKGVNDDGMEFGVSDAWNGKLEVLWRGFFLPHLVNKCTVLKKAHFNKFLYIHSITMIV